MQLILDSLTWDDMLTIREWRNREEVRATLRTPYMLTPEMQEEFYRTIVCNRVARARYFAIRSEDRIRETEDRNQNPEIQEFKNSRIQRLVGYGGIENIQWENGLGEISLLINPDLHRKGYGRAALLLIFNEGFHRMGLRNLWGEAYYSSQSYLFWLQMVTELNGFKTTMPERKYWNSHYYDGLFFNFSHPM